MSKIPSNLRYTKAHEWARLEDDGTVVVGITDHAVNTLGDITLVTLPTVGTRLTADQEFGTIDSVKAVSELYAPIDGEVIAVNTELDASPEDVNTDCYGDGWMLRIRPTDSAAIERLLTAAQYEAHLKEE
ncbi:glycine cleavage system H protein [Nannocystis exedens]|uniref:Glycine cleavage system H protein n=1 Tax=Nannocystis exedens TaxID=54 RepID=A0A1I2EA12_9BACT|nr:glycine cleavage system protein GcvH [Nannocystis exedens]PCC74852.1 glycine cleavage system protein H [Nannocystis exedens]SFE89772.1 glycine cleavage system H protein [Nannocystis exedens]